MSDTDTERRARASDPETSQRAATEGRADDQALRDRLLIEWALAGPDGLTDEEAADRATLLNRTFWKRAGECREPRRGGETFAAVAGAPLLEWHPEGLTRVGRSKSARKVSVITARGMTYVLERGLLPDDPAELHAEIDRLRAVIAGARQVCEQGGTRTDVLHALES